MWHLHVGHSTLILVSRYYDHYNLFVSWFTFPLKLNVKSADLASWLSPGMHDTRLSAEVDFQIEHVPTRKRP